MPGTIVEDVSSSAYVEGAEMRVTDIEVNRTIGTTADQATIEGIVDDVDNLELNQGVEVYVNGQKIFTGELQKAVQDEEGLVTMDVYGPLLEFHNKNVLLNTDREQNAWVVLVDLLDDAGYYVTTRYGDALDHENPVFIENQSEFISGDVTITAQYGSADRGEILSTVVEDLITKLHAEIWTDRNGILRIEQYPRHRSYEARLITELNSGEETTNTERVVVKGGSPVGDLGPAASHVYSQSSHTAVVERGDTGEGVEKTLTDQNVVTKEGTDSTASSEMFKSARRSSPGDIKLVGNTDIELFDIMEVPQFEYTSPLSDKKYMIKSLRHTVNASDGFTTKVTFSDEPTSLLEALTGSAGDLGSLFGARINDRRINAGALLPIVGFTDSGIGIIEQVLNEE